jgi:competence protein ComEC
MMPPPAGCFALHLLDVGQGEAIIIDLPNGAFGLVDAGPHSSKEVVLDALRARQDRDFRFAAYTHWDADHIGALPDVLRMREPQDLVRPHIDMGLMRELCARLDGKDAPRLIDEVSRLETGLRVFPMGARQNIRDVGPDTEIWALAPGGPARNNIRNALRGGSAGRIAANLRQARNAVSLVLWIRVFGRALLLPGEVDADMAGELMQQFARVPGNVPADDPRAVWLKLSHHGSKTGSSAELFRLFGQDSFVASASHGAQYGHPHPRVLGLVREGGHGRAMCTRLGHGCRQILQESTRFPAGDLSWSGSDAWKDGEKETRARAERCYGSVTVIVRPGGACSVSGTMTDRRDCPFGGPVDGHVDFADPLRPASA